MFNKNLLKLFFAPVLLCIVVISWGCSKHLFIKIEETPSVFTPAFIISKDKQFSSSVELRSLTVLSKRDEKWDAKNKVWDIKVNENIKARETAKIVYGELPKGFVEKVPPKELKPHVEYLLAVISVRGVGSTGFIIEETPENPQKYRIKKVY